MQHQPRTQVVAVRGLNPTGSVFVAQSICTHVPPRASAPPPPPPSSATPPAAAHGTQLAQRGTSLVAACGPFTTVDNLLYEPLTELLRHATQIDADTVVLMGPFVDVEHSAIKDGSLNVPFDVLMREQVCKRIGAWQADPVNACRRVVVLPAVRDVTAQPCFPTPPLPMDGTVPDRTSCVQSPSTFALDGLRVSALSTDVLLHLSASELWRGPSTDRMAALASHVLGQRCFYPLSPPPLGTCLDTAHAASLRLDEAPDLLLMPSNLAPFAKLLNTAPEGLPPGCAPPTGTDTAAAGSADGRLSKGVSGGTFAHVVVAPGDGPAHCRTRVDIRRL
ncbi:hypothetical protein FOA52_005583 [Chlamydomonas sp. UWO 241]|nr:hypothetical protein FOA52_005583 [Chlamydomonas sp. UWO 241]